MTSHHIPPGPPRWEAILVNIVYLGIVITTIVTSACLLSCVEVVMITMLGKQAVSEVEHEAPYTKEIYPAI
jgi:hypothetical protein